MKTTNTFVALLFTFVGLTGCNNTAQVNYLCENLIDHYGEGNDEQMYGECVALGQIKSDLANRMYRDSQARRNARAMVTRLENSILARGIETQHDLLSTTLESTGLDRASYE